MLKVEKMAIVGTGLLGASIGLGLRKAGYRGRIVGVGRRRETVERARQRGCVDVASTDLAAGMGESQLMILATPLRQFPDLLKQIEQLGPNSLTITDVGSSKQLVCRQARDCLADPSRFVGSHPMAGGEQHGPENAADDLFAGKPCVITPESDTNPQAIELVESLWSTLGMRLVHMPPDEHDHQVARISHLPHALAVLLVELAAKEGGLDLASTGFRDATRVASGDPKVWLDIFMTNRQAMIESIDQFADQLGRFRAMLAGVSEQPILEMLCRGKARRDWWGQQ